MVGGRRPLLPEILDQSEPPRSKKRSFPFACVSVTHCTALGELKFPRIAYSMYAHEQRHRTPMTR